MMTVSRWRVGFREGQPERSNVITQAAVWKERIERVFAKLN